MAGFMNQIASAVRGFLNALKTIVVFFIGVAWVLYLSFLAIGAAAVSLSAIQLQDDIGASLEGGFNDVLRKQEKFQSQKEAILRNIEAKDVTPKYQSLSEDAEDIMRAIRWNLRWHSDGDLPGPPSNVGLNAFIESNAFRDLLISCEGDVKADFKSDLCDPAEALLEVQAEISDMSGDLEEFFEVRKSGLEEIDTLLEKEPLAEHFNTIEFFTRLGLEVFLLMPRPMLVIILTIAMGTLGGVITMTWTFVRRDKSFGARAFVLLPWIGAMSALVILVFAKAGQITLTTGTDPGSLNPFFISFLGIISGLLSERAYIRMSRIGTKFFETEDDVPRWGLGLRAVSEKAGLDLENLAEMLNVSTEELNNILDGKTTANTFQQTLIAAAVQQPLQVLFTDIRPSTKQVLSQIPEPEPAHFWGVDLQGHLDRENLSTDALARQLDLEADHVMHIVAGKMPVDKITEDRIAAYLRRSPDELFTKTPPQKDNAVPADAAPETPPAEDMG